jgi:hypothetical protein
MSNCFCVGKQPGCTCDGACRCACTCPITDKDFTEFSDWMIKIETEEDRDKLTLPPNCS